jgi:glycerol-3-phosphate dehydrogenase
MNHRESALQHLRENPRVPVLILGGGVNGTGLFRELALQGVDCLLVDKADFVAGASSKSSRMIHGGLRYLESREFKLVRESLFERNRLLENAAHYVTPLRTTIPLFSRLGGLLKSSLVFLGFNVRPGGRGKLIVKLGLSFYDFVTRKNRRTPRHYLTSRRKSLEAIPGLNPNIVATATYWDAQISQAERLCIEMIQDACAANPNCRALNYARILDVARLACPAVSSGRDNAPGDAGTVGQADRGTTGGGTAPSLETPQGATITFKDEVTGQQVSVEPSIVVNATGAWVDFTNAVMGMKTQFIGGTKGSHLVVDNRQLYDALGGQMVYYEHKDGRVCIVFPFGDKVLMGSTEIRIDDPETARCEESEIDYMLTTLRGVFPNVRIRREEIVYTFCGVRPLPASGSEVTATISRGHSIRVIEPEGTRPFPVFCLIGGKWTTFRAFAEEAADQILPRLGVRRRCSTQHTPIGGGRDFPLSADALPGSATVGLSDRAGKDTAGQARRGTAEAGVETREEWIARVAGRSGLTKERVATLLDRYGTKAEAYARGTDARAKTPLKSLPDYTVGEIERIAADEQVVHLTDLLCRRSTIALLGRATSQTLQELADIVGRILGWDQPGKEEELRQALAELAAPTRPGGDSVLPPSGLALSR